MNLTFTQPTRLSRIVVEDVSQAGITSLFTVPTGSFAIIDEVSLHSNSADMARGAGAVDIDFGFGSTASNPVWVSAVDLSSVNVIDSAFPVRNDNTPLVMGDGDAAIAADRIFTMVIIDAPDAAGTLIVDTFGYLVSNS